MNENDEIDVVHCVQFTVKTLHEALRPLGGKVVVLVGMPNSRVAFASSADTADFSAILRTALAHSVITPTHQGTETKQ